MQHFEGRERVQGARRLHVVRDERQERQGEGRVQGQAEGAGKEGRAQEEIVGSRGFAYQRIAIVAVMPKGITATIFSTGLCRRLGLLGGSWARDFLLLTTMVETSA